eukprot:6197793-Pleurochrysis_carterae.AAC.4
MSNVYAHVAHSVCLALLCRCVFCAGGQARPRAANAAAAHLREWRGQPKAGERAPLVSAELE